MPSDKPTPYANNHRVGAAKGGAQTDGFVRDPTVRRFLASPMNEGIELHDSELSAVSFSDGSAVVSLSPAYLHRSSGVPGSDAGSGWSQPATLTFAGTSPVSLPAKLPAWVSDGLLRIGDTVHKNLIPASGCFEGAVEFSIVLVTAETLTIRGQQVTIQLHGEPSYIEDFNP